ncbi:MAG: MtnX-like HAD-IB family phosphatase [Syntrophomonadaceae bacterium]|jgi:2-hydroxy-3-keto-5-methylthiopentenyl-1-phosphate phosphatase
MNKKLMVFADFDGTITVEDVCGAMVVRYAGEGWEKINQLWVDGVISTEECAQKTLDLMDVSPEELEILFNQAEIDKTFPDFLEWLKEHGFPLSIVSDGYDNYIKLILQKNGLNLPYYANHLDYNNGWKIKCSYLFTDCQKCGVCKTKIIESLLLPGYTSVYVGDGYSDICPADKCDILFAKKYLAAYCEKEGIPFYPYNNFGDVKKKLKELLAVG